MRACGVWVLFSFFFLAPQDVVGVSRDLNNKKKNRGSSGFSTVSPIVVLRPLGCFVLVIELELWDFGGIFVWFMRIHEESWEQDVARVGWCTCAAKTREGTLVRILVYNGK